MSHELTEGRAAPWHATPGLALAFYGFALLLVALATLGALNPGRYVAVSVLFDHPFLFGVPMLGALAVAVWIGSGPVVLRATGLGLTTAAAFLYGGFGVLNWMAGMPRHQIVEERSPAGQWEVRVIEGHQVIDTVWELRVRHPDGLLSKEWSAGCLNGDSPDDGFEGVKWASATSLAVTVTDGRVLRVDLDPTTGAPLRKVLTGAGC